MAERLRIGIIETGLVSPPLDEDYPSYPSMFCLLLDEVDDTIHYETISVVQGDSLPNPNKFDGYIITGSKYGVYDDQPWIKPLKDFVVSADISGRRQVGICFGHQIMAEAFGGKVEKSSKGWGVGFQQYDVTAAGPWMDGSSVSVGDRIKTPAMHQDQVVIPPSGAEVIVSSDFCRYAGFKLSDNAITYQFHPEFDDDYMEDLIKLRKGTVIPDDIAARGIASIDGSEDRFQVARWMVNHLKRED